MQNIQFINSNQKPRSILNKTCIILIFRMNIALHKGTLKACVGKRGYNSYQHALRVKEKREQDNKVVYPCPYCFKWHIGRDEDNEIVDYPFEVTVEMIQGFGFKEEYENGLIEILKTLKYIGLI